jgi:hypothetical protein
VKLRRSGRHPLLPPLAPSADSHPPPPPLLFSPVTLDAAAAAPPLSGLYKHHRLRSFPPQPPRQAFRGVPFPPSPSPPSTAGISGTGRSLRLLLPSVGWPPSPPLPRGDRRGRPVRPLPIPSIRWPGETRRRRPLRCGDRWDSVAVPSPSPASWGLPAVERARETSGY